LRPTDNWLKRLVDPWRDICIPQVRGSGRFGEHPAEHVLVADWAVSADGRAEHVQTHHQADLLSPEQAAAEIENPGVGVAEIGARSQEFAGLMAVRPILYELFDDYGMGAVRLAFKAETDGLPFR
jgi:hypothetical protein